MNTLNDKTARRALIVRYLEAETSPAEERQLREWFATHPADEDEADMALLVGLAAPCASGLPEVEREMEFDAIVAYVGNALDGIGEVFRQHVAHGAYLDADRIFFHCISSLFKVMLRK